MSQELDRRQHGSYDQSAPGPLHGLEHTARQEIQSLRIVRISELAKSSQDHYSLYQELAATVQEFALLVNLPGVIDTSFSRELSPKHGKRSITLQVPRKNPKPNEPLHDKIYIVACEEEYMKGYFRQYWKLPVKSGFPEIPEGGIFILKTPSLARMSFEFQRLELPTQFPTP